MERLTIKNFEKLPEQIEIENLVSILSKNLTEWKESQILNALKLKGYILNTESEKKEFAKNRLSVVPQCNTETYCIDGMPFLRIRFVQKELSFENKVTQPEYIAEILF